MAPKGTISQCKVFYTAQWTKEVDHKFVEMPLKQKKLGNLQVGRSNAHAILTTMVDVNHHFQTNFDYAFCLGRVKKLDKWYKFFNWIISLSGVYYNPSQTRFNATRFCGTSCAELVA